jgi:hypothetical protein
VSVRAWCAVAGGRRVDGARAGLGAGSTRLGASGPSVPRVDTAVVVSTGTLVVAWLRSLKVVGVALHAAVFSSNGWCADLVACAVATRDAAADR